MKRTVRYLVLLCALSGSVFPVKPTKLVDSYRKAGVRMSDAEKYMAVLNEKLRYVHNEEDLVGVIFACIPNSIKNSHNQLKMVESIKKQVSASVAEQGFQQLYDIAKTVLSNHLVMFRCRTVNTYPDQEVRLRDYAGRSIADILADLE
ncbi:hypothetical protein IPF37_04705 [bacterium]|nr:MAG: hypothetical protein IPF37_04705 [bacterium]